MIKFKNIFVLFCLFGLFLFIFLRYNRNFEIAIPLVGDEPTYMAMSDSLVHFKTFNLSREIETQHWQTFYFEDYPLHTVDISANKRFPKHGLGWPLILAPLFYFSDNPRLLAMFAQNIIVVLLALNIFLWLKENKFSFWLSLFVSSVIVFSLPIAVQTHFLFSEPLAALCLLYAVRKLEKPNILSTLAIAFLPWIHIKYLIFYPVLLLSYINKRPKKIIQLPPPNQRWFMLVIMSSILILVVFNIYAFGTPFSGQEKLNSFFRSFSGLLGIWADKGSGLLAYAPIYILGFLGFGYLLSQKKKEFYRLAYLTSSLIFLTGIFESWSGGQAPPARMILAVLPLFALPLATVLVLPWKWFFRIVFGLLVLPSIFLGFQSRWQPILTINRYLYPGLNSFTINFNLPIDLEQCFPLNIGVNYLTIIWMFILIGLFIFGMLLFKFRNKLEKLDEIIDYHPRF